MAQRTQTIPNAGHALNSPERSAIQKGEYRTRGSFWDRLCNAQPGGASERERARQCAAPAKPTFRELRRYQAITERSKSFDARDRFYLILLSVKSVLPVVDSRISHLRPQRYLRSIASLPPVPPYPCHRCYPWLNQEFLSSLCAIRPPATLRGAMWAWWLNQEFLPSSFILLSFLGSPRDSQRAGLACHSSVQTRG
jgi:hypothetical protein